MEAFVEHLPNPFSIGDEDDEEETESKQPALPKPTLPLAVRRDTSSVSCPIFKNMCKKIFDDDQFPHVIVYLDSCSVAGVWVFVNGLIQSNTNLKRHRWKGRGCH